MAGVMARTGQHLDAKPFGGQPREGCRTVVERAQILVGLAREDSLTAIVSKLGRAVSAISCEVGRCGGRETCSV